MIGVTPPWLIDSSLWAGSITAVIVFLKVVTGWKPAQFVWQRLVHDPARGAMADVAREEIQPMLEQVLGQILPNGGKSFRDAVDKTNAKLEEFMVYQHEANHRMDGTIKVAVKGIASVGQIVQDHTEDDAAKFGTIIDGMAEAKALALEAKHDLAKFNENNTLGRQGRVDRRHS